MGGLATLLVALGGEGEILEDPRVQCGDVLVLRPGEAVLVKSPCGFLGRAGAREGEHGAVFEPEVVGMLRQPALRKVKRGQELPAPLLEFHRLEPLARGVRLGRTGRRRLSDGDIVGRHCRG